MAGKKTISGISDIPLADWKAHDDLFTDSLWILGNRDNSGQHTGHYHGNFVPQIPNQLMRRFTAADDVVLDCFLGSGTTCIEAIKLGRNSIGIELLPAVADAADKLAGAQARETEGSRVFHEVICADSAAPEISDKLAGTLARHGKKHVNLIILHPPYHDIIKFSADPLCLSNSKTSAEFYSQMTQIVTNTIDFLPKNYYIAVVIGDKYAQSKWEPLGFGVMNALLTAHKNLILKSVIVKNMMNNRAKRNNENLWRYRALGGGFYIFKHEYILLFQKK